MPMRVIILFWLSLPAFTQSGMLSGTATDSKQHPVAGARIAIQRTTDRTVQLIRSDKQGRFTISLSPGTYTLKADDDAFEQGMAGPFTVESNKALSVTVILKAQYFDEPQFTVAGVTDNTYRGGHGSGAALRSSETLTRQTAALGVPEQTGDPLKTVAQLQRAAEADPSEPNLFNWGTELLSHLAPAAAGQVFSKGVRMFPQSTRMLLGLASAQYAAGDYEKAGRSFFEAADLNPLDPKPYLFLAQVERREITDTPEYTERLARFAALHPEDAVAQCDYGIALWNRHDVEQAIAHLKESIRLDPKLSKAHVELARIDAANGNYAQAIAEYRKAPDLEEAHYGLSEAYRITGNRAGAAEELARYKQMSAQSSAKLEQERRAVQQFVVSLKNQ